MFSLKAFNFPLNTSTPQYVFMAWCLVKHGHNFNFYLRTSISGHSKKKLHFCCLYPCFIGLLSRSVCHFHIWLSVPPLSYIIPVVIQILCFIQQFVCVCVCVYVLSVQNFICPPSAVQWIALSRCKLNIDFSWPPCCFTF
jgi:hypothetical protein